MRNDCGHIMRGCPTEDMRGHACDLEYLDVGVTGATPVHGHQAAAPTEPQPAVDVSKQSNFTFLSSKCQMIKILLVVFYI